MTLNEYGELALRRRDVLGVHGSLKRLAAHLGVAPQTLACYECGIRRMPREKAKQWARACKVTLEWALVRFDEAHERRKGA